MWDICAKPRWIVAMLAISLVVVSSPAWATPISWTGAVAGGNWTTVTNWSSNPALPTSADDVTLTSGTPGTAATYTLGQNWDFNSLTIANKAGVGNGTADNANTITLESGNLNVSGSWTFGAGITANLAIPDSAGANAVWNWTGASGNYVVNGITASSAVTITKKGSELTIFAKDNSATLHANWNLQGPVQFNASNGMGDGTITFSNGQTVTFNGTALSAPNNWNINGQTAGFSMGSGNTATLNGNITGTGTVTKDVTGSYGTLVLAGANNTFTGNLVPNRGTMALDGTFTGLGNVTMLAGTNGAAYLAGTGNVGMASGKAVSLTGAKPVSTIYSANLAPGRNGTIGTLTVGTAGNGNSVSLNAYSYLLSDVNATTSDDLVVNGDLKLTAATNALYINSLATMAASSYTLASYTGNLTGTFGAVYYDGTLVANPTDPAGTIGPGYQLVYGPATGGGTINLLAVPEPATMTLLTIGAVVLMARRRRSA